MCLKNPGNVPNILEWNSKLFMIHDDLLQLAPIGITPPGLMIAKGKVLLHSRQANGLSLIRRGHFIWSGAGKEVKINTSTNCTPGDVLLAQEDLLTMCIAEVYAMRVGYIFILSARIASEERQVACGVVDFEISSLEIKGVRTVYIAITESECRRCLIGKSHSLINWVTRISRPHSLREVIPQSKPMNCFA